MMDLFRLSAKLTLDSSEYSKGLVESEKSGKGFANRLSARTVAIGNMIGNFATAAVTKTASIIKQTIGDSVRAYADYEQLVGGVETLFGTNNRTLEEYQKSVGITEKSSQKQVEKSVSDYARLERAQASVMQNAEVAFRTSGLDMNAYMETVTSFSAALINGLKGDTEQAAKVADMAVVDMSDNANKMGTNIQSIQNAYQGFAKGNFTMLDNLKLGYGGTRTEMQRLLKDATKIQKQNGKNVKYNINNLADIYEAIHVIQTEMGITGTTAAEADKTISGSIASMKAAWTNLMIAFGDPDADLSVKVKDFADSLRTVVRNVFPALGRVVSGLWQSFRETVADLPGLIFGRTEDGKVAWPDWKKLGAKAAELWQNFCNTVADFTGLEFGRDSEGNVKLPSISDVVEQAIERYKDIKQAIGEAIEKIGGIVFEIGSGIADTTGFTVVREFGQWVMNNGQTLTDLLGTVGTQLALFKISSMAVSGVTTLQNFFSTLSTLSLGEVAGNITTIAGNLPVIVSKISPLVVAMWLIVPALIQITKDLDKLPKGWELFESSAKNAIDSVKCKVEEIKGAITTAIDTAWKRMQQFVSDFASGKLFANIGENVRNGIVKFFNDTFGTSFPLFDMNGDGVTVDMSCVTSEAKEASDAIELASLDLENLDGAKASATIDVKAKVPTLWEIVRSVFGGGGNSSASDNDTPGGTADDFARRHGHAKGLWNVPYTGYIASLHRGEMILNTSRARDYREDNGRFGGSADIAAQVAGAIREAMQDVVVRSYLSSKDITDDVSRNTTRALKARRFAT